MNIVFIIWGLSYLGIAIMEFKETITLLNMLQDRFDRVIYAISLAIMHIISLPFAPIVLIIDIIRYSHKLK